MKKTDWNAVLASYESALSHEKMPAKERLLHVKEASRFAAFLKKKRVPPSQVTTLHLDEYQDHLRAEVERAIEALIRFVKHVADHLGDRL